MMEFPILTDKEIIMSIDCDDERTYKWEGESLTIVNIDKTLQAQRDQTLKDVVRWGDELCPYVQHRDWSTPRRMCRDCWAELRKQAGME
jgi:hypothetical protein